MNELIEHIRAAVAQGATAEQKALGAQACRTILTALDAEPGKPIAAPAAPQAHPMSRLTIDQVLDLAIARLTTVANAHDAEAATATAAPAQRGAQVKLVPPPLLSVPGTGRKR